MLSKVAQADSWWTFREGWIDDVKRLVESWTAVHGGGGQGIYNPEWVLAWGRTTNGERLCTTFNNKITYNRKHRDMRMDIWVLYRPAGGALVFFSMITWLRIGFKIHFRKPRPRQLRLWGENGFSTRTKSFIQRRTLYPRKIHNFEYNSSLHGTTVKTQKWL